MNYYTLAVVIAIPVSFLVIWIYYRWKFINEEMADIMSKCLEIEKNCKEGYAVFYPPEGEEYLYKKLAKKGLLWKNPLGGYSFEEAKDRMWAGKSLDGITGVKPKNYQDDDGVIQVYTDDSGNVIRTVTQEDLARKREKKWE